MNITQVKIFPVDEEKLKAFVSIVFDHCFMVNDIKIIQGKDGLFLSMPSRRKKSGEFKDVAHPLNNETRRAIEETVLGEYRAMVDDPTPRRPDREGDETGEGVAVPLAASSGNGSGRFVEAAEARAASATPTARDDEPPAQVEAGAEDDGADDKSGERTLEEVQEMHLRDSFWSVS